MKNSLENSPPPERNPKAFGLSDLLPAAMVKDWRQSLRSPLYLILIVLGLVLMYVYLQPRAGFRAEQVIGNWDNFLIFSGVLLMVLVPFRAALSIAGDIRERGSNFLQLCPLSSTRIIYGQFLSGAFQLLLLTLALAPLMYSYQETARASFGMTIDFMGIAIPLYAFCSISLAAIYLLSLFTLAMMMALAGLPLILRLMALNGLLLFLIPITAGSDLVFNSEYPNAPELLRDLCSMSVYLVVGTLCALHLAKRHYCSFVEVRSGVLRILAALFIAAPLLFISLSLKSHSYSEFYMMIKASLGFSLIWIFLDELMPRQRFSTKHLRIFALNRCSSMSTVYCILIFCGLAYALPYLAPHLGLYTDISPERMQHLLSLHLRVCLAVFSSSLFVLSLVELCFKPTSNSRLMGFIIILGVSTLLMIQLNMVLEDHFDLYLSEYLPLLNLCELDTRGPATNHQLLHAVLIAMGFFVLYCVLNFIRRRNDVA